MKYRVETLVRSAYVGHDAHLKLQKLLGWAKTRWPDRQCWRPPEAVESCAEEGWRRGGGGLESRHGG
jgi:hypothetical protein